MPTQQVPLPFGMTPTGAILWKWSVLNYDALSSLTDQIDGEIARVIEPQGTKWLPGSLGGTYWPSGLYTWVEAEAKWKMDATIEQIADALNNASGGLTSLLWSTTSFNPADSTTYYFAAIQGQAASTALSAWQRHKLPAAASEFTLNIGYLRTNSASNEGVTITLNNHTKATSVNFTANWDMGTLSPQVYNATLACDANDDISISIDTPAWATNPLSVRVYMLLNFS